MREGNIDAPFSRKESLYLVRLHVRDLESKESAIQRNIREYSSNIVYM